MIITKRLRALMLALCLPGSLAIAAVPAGYYDNINTANGQVLRDSLHEIIDDHQRFPYTSTATDTWDLLEQADQDPANAANVIDIYKNASYPKAGGGNSFYNREHSWPKSYGFPTDGSDNYPYTDGHHLFISDSGYNSSRSNKPYDNCTSGCDAKPTDSNHGRGAGEANYTAGGNTDGSWQTWSGRRGDVARALMYLDVRYEGGTHSVTGTAEPDLILTDDRALIANSNQGSNLSVAYMGIRSVLLQWHQEDPVDDFERRHNDAIYGFQGNRNPFVDHPEYVACVFTEDCSGLDGSGGSGGGSGGGGSGPAASAWINEFHYDNDGTDSNEFVEVAGTAGLDLNGWSLVAYNGTNGAQYMSVSLSGSLTNQSNGFGTLSVAMAGLQNGAPDGLALVNASGAVVQFISYEGSMTATDGAAQGMTSIDIGISETGTTPVGHSLQLVGSGSQYADFTWQAASHSAGTINNGQSFASNGGGSSAPVQSVFENNQTLSIPDKSSVISNIEVDRDGNAGTLDVSVNISHSYRGDISLTLYAPDGSSTLLQNYNGGDGAQDLVKTYQINLTSAARGIWQLKVTDHYKQDVGQLNNWSLTFK
ncbi:endonuclease [Aliiglaciecola sp. CAU 1673]|uniref:endonuclease n=1 Tax=Aliiglaciecola sp. CAU 1673 TaxID=3032595 RepID=UPI0023DA5D18|nr:endonuclease [Aliiglaciecola sp. CAU 1673]MDF2178501.1 endonuclease [Aliiglaciecola sp. CAU 1673]